MFIAQSRINCGSHDGIVNGGMNNNYGQSGPFGNSGYYIGQPSNGQSMYGYPEASCKMSSDMGQNYNRSVYQNELRFGYSSSNVDYGANYNAGPGYNSHCTTDARMGYGTGDTTVHSANYPGANSTYPQGNSHFNNNMYVPPSVKPNCSPDGFVKPFGDHYANSRPKGYQDPVSVKSERDHCSYPGNCCTNGQSYSEPQTGKEDCLRYNQESSSYQPLTPPPSEPNTSPPLNRKTPPPPYPAKYNRRNNPELEKRRTHFCNFAGNNFTYFYDYFPFKVSAVLLQTPFS